MPRSLSDASSLLQRFRQIPAVAALARDLGATPLPRLQAGGLWGASSAFLVAALAADDTHPWLLVTPGTEEADTACGDLATLLPGRAFSFPAWESLPGEALAPDPRVFSGRLGVLRALATPGPRPPVIAAPAAAVLQPVLAREELARHALHFRTGDTYPREELVFVLTEEGELERTPAVEFAGECAVRGSLVDLFPHGLPGPVRLEFSGDTLESIRLFDPATQLSNERLSEITIPVLPRSRFFTAAWSRDAVTLFDHLPPGTRIALLEPTVIRERLDHHFEAEVDETGHLEAPVRPAAPIEEDDPTPGVWFLTRTTRFPRLELSALPWPPAPGCHDVATRSTQRFTGDLAGVVGELRRLLGECDEFAICCARAGEAERLNEILTEAGLGDEPRLAVLVGTLGRGFQVPAARLAVVPNHEIFHRYHLRCAAREARQARPIESFLELERGDYVVHLHHGIGRYLGLERQPENGRVQESLVLEYSGATKLRVPVASIELVQKYVGVGDASPDLSLIGGPQWEKRKARAVEAVAEMAADLLEIQAQREQQPGTAFGPDTPFQHEFEASFPFEDTEDQVAATIAIKADMMSTRPMDRLICGDVGKWVFNLETVGSAETIFAPGEARGGGDAPVHRRRRCDWHDQKYRR